jgi:hypothetical protein
MKPESKNRHITIRNSYPLFGKLLGMIFIAFGGYFGWITLIRSIPSEITVELLFFVLFDVAFIITGFSLLLASSVVVIDPGNNLVLIARDFKLFKRVDKYALNEFHSVVYETDSEGTNPTVALEL